MRKIGVLAIIVFFIGAVVSCSLMYASMNNVVKTTSDNLILSQDTDTDVEPAYEPTWHIMGEYGVYNNQLYEKKYMGMNDYTWIPVGAEATPTAGFVSIYFLNHSATPTTTYLKNTSTAYENWSLNMGCGGKYAYSKSTGFNPELKANTAFDVLIRCKFTRTQGPWNGTKWIGTNVRVNITVSGDFTITNLLGGWVETFNSSSASTYYGNAYWQSTTAAAGSGLQIHPGATISFTSIVISAKY